MSERVKFKEQRVYSIVQDPIIVVDL